MRGGLIAVSVAVTLAPGADALAQARPADWPMWERWTWWMPVHGLLSLLVLAAIILGIVWIVRSLGRDRDGAPTASRSKDTALDILNGRYARGEIDREEYLQRKRDLSAKE